MGVKVSVRGVAGPRLNLNVDFAVRQRLRSNGTFKDKSGRVVTPRDVAFEKFREAAAAARQAYTQTLLDVGGFLTNPGITSVRRTGPKVSTYPARLTINGLSDSTRFRGYFPRLTEKWIRRKAKKKIPGAGVFWLATGRTALFYRATATKAFAKPLGAYYSGGAERMRVDPSGLVFTRGIRFPPLRQPVDTLIRESFTKGMTSRRGEIPELTRHQLRFRGGIIIFPETQRPILRQFAAARGRFLRRAISKLK